MTLGIMGRITTGFMWQTSLTGFWQVPFGGTLDPSIPNFALEVFPAIRLVGTKSSTAVAGAAGNTVLALDTGLVDGSFGYVRPGDLVVAIQTSAAPSDVALTITDGTNAYTLIGSELYSDGSSFDAGLRVAYKFMGATPDTGVTFGPSGEAASGSAIAVYVFSGVDSTSPLDVTEVAATATGNRPNPGSLTPVTPGAAIVSIGTFTEGAGAASLSNNGDFAQFWYALADNTNDSHLGVGVKTDWISGAFDPAAFSGTGGNAGSNAWCALNLALRPSAGITNKSIPAAAGSYSIDGVAAGLKLGRVIAAAAGSYSITGTGAGLKHGWVTAAAAGSYSITGTGAGLKHGWVTAAAAGSYAVTGQAAGLVLSRKIAAAPGSYSLTGTGAGLTKSATGAKSIVAGLGSYDITGSPATLRKGWVVTAAPGSYDVTGAAATLRQSRRLTAGAGSYAVTGTSATLRRARITSAGAGSYALTGAAAGLRLGRKLVAAPGGYAMTGTDATLSYLPNSRKRGQGFIIC